MAIEKKLYPLFSHIRKNVKLSEIKERYKYMGKKIILRPNSKMIRCFIIKIFLKGNEIEVKIVLTKYHLIEISIFLLLILSNCILISYDIICSNISNLDILSGVGLILFAILVGFKLYAYTKYLDFLDFNLQEKFQKIEGLTLLQK